MWFVAQSTKYGKSKNQNQILLNDNNLSKHNSIIFICILKYKIVIKLL